MTESEYERTGARIISTLYERSGVDLRADKDGLWAGGWYDSFVGIESVLIPWSEIDAARKVAEQSAKRAEARAERAGQGKGRRT